MKILHVVIYCNLGLVPILCKSISNKQTFLATSDICGGFHKSECKKKLHLDGCTVHNISADYRKLLVYYCVTSCYEHGTHTTACLLRHPNIKVYFCMVRMEKLICI